MREIQCPKGLEQYIAKLGLKWPVQWFVTEDAVLYIMSVPGVGHSIYVPRVYLHKLVGGEWKSNFVHELCHAFLGERLHPLFACSAIDSGLEQLDDFKDKYAMFAWAVNPVQDVWVNAFMHGQVDKTLAFDGIRTYWEAAKRGARRDTVSAGGETYSVTATALAIAEIRRYRLSGYENKIPNMFGFIARQWGGQARERTEQLIQLYEGLPSLPSQAPKALQIFELAVKTACRILGFSIQPRIVTLEGREVWTW